MSTPTTGTTTTGTTTTPPRPFRAREGDEDWTDDLLTRRTYAVLGTENPDGSVHMVPLMFAFDGERFLFETNAATRKVRNLEARPRARVLVQGIVDDMEAWVSAAGETEIVRGAEAQQLNRTVIERYTTEEGARGWTETMGPLDDVTVVLRPSRWWSWSLAATVEVMVEPGYDLEEVAAWFHPLDH